MQDTSRLCIHTITTKPWSIETAIEKYAKAGVHGVSVWQQALEGRSISECGNRIREAGLEVVSYVRGGFFPSTSSEKRTEAIEHNKKMIEESHALGAPLLVLVCGSDPDQSLDTSRVQIQSGIEAILPFAEQAQVKLAIEPLHPMYADTRSAITTLTDANDMAERLNSPFAGVAIDVYHLWWDNRLYHEIERCAQNDNLFAFHVCDWRIPTRDMLNDRTIMGQGCIPVTDIRRAVDNTGYDGFIEVEIFSEEHWQEDQDKFLAGIIEGYISST